MASTIIIYTVTYKQTPKSPQREVTFYTQALAKKFAKLVEEDGGVAVMTEDTEEDGQDQFETLPIPPSMKDNLTW